MPTARLSASSSITQANKISLHGYSDYLNASLITGYHIRDNKDAIRNSCNIQLKGYNLLIRSEYE